jgi:hypothetical protein
MKVMTDAPTLELLYWVSSRPRTYDEAMDAWRSHCPRLLIWEDALLAGLVRVVRSEGGSRVELTPAGEAALRAGSETGSRSFDSVRSFSRHLRA